MTRRLLERFPALDPSRINASELAAIVFEEGVAVDHLTAFFADELKAAGRNVGGLIYLPDDDEPPADEMTVVDLLAGDHWLEPRSGGGPAAFAMATRRILASIEARADLAFIPRFGAAEMTGGGYADAFGTVAAFGVPILTVVQRANVDAWLQFTGGVGTLLACRLRIVRAWWQETDSRRQKILARETAAKAEGAKVVPLLPTFE